MINVLSVDWDYFMDCDRNYRVNMFPDGNSELIGIMLSNIVWSTRYADSLVKQNRGLVQTGLKEVGILEKDYQLLKKSIKDSYGSTTLLADSHADIYDFIKNHLDLWGYDTAQVYNIDFHSDTYNLGTELNCGNWANKLDEEHKLSKYTWIKRDSDEDISGSLKNCEVAKLDDIKPILDIHWDLIFVCRSSIWTPPHLDTRFNELKALYYDIGIEFSEEFFIDRYDCIKNNVQSLYDTYNKLSNE